MRQTILKFRALIEAVHYLVWNILIFVCMGLLLWLVNYFAGYETSRAVVNIYLIGLLVWYGYRFVRSMARNLTR